MIKALFVIVLSCLFVRLFVCLFVCLLVCLFVYCLPVTAAQVDGGSLLLDKAERMPVTSSGSFM